LFELEEDVSPGSLHASLPVPAEVPSASDMTHAVEKGEVRSLLFAGYYKVGGWSGGCTHNEPTALIIDILLQRCLTQMLGKVGASTPRTNLIIHHGVTDIFYQATNSIHILATVQDPCDLASLY
jgi:hypothetical protein